MPLVKFVISVLLFLFLPTYALDAQDPSYQQFQVKDGLPSSEVYDVLVDRIGDIWVTTDRGVARFNGYEFEIFTTVDGLTDNTNFKVYEDYKGRIWFLAFNGTICYFENGTFHPHPLNDQISIISTYWWEDIIVFEDNRIQLFERQSVAPILNQFLEINTSWDSLKILGHIDEPAYSNTEIVLHSDIRLINSKISNNWIYYHNNYFGEVNIRHALAAQSLPDSTTILYSSGFNQDDKYTPNNGLFLIKNNKLIGERYLNTPIYQTLIHDDQFLVCTENGILNFDPADLSKPQSVYFKDLAVAAIEKDDEGNFWVATLEKGLLCLPNLEVFSITKTNDGQSLDQVYEMKIFKEHFVLGAARNIVLLDEKLNCKTLISNIQFIPYHIPELNNNLLVPGYKTEILPELTVQKGNRRHSFQSNLKKIGDSVILHTTNQLLKIHQKDIYEKKITVVARKILFPRKVLCFEQLSNSITIASTLKGLFKVDWTNLNQIERIPINTIFNNPRIIKILALDEQSFLFATNGEGLGLIAGDKIFRYTSKDGLGSNFINNLYLENSETLWACTNSGLDQIKFSYDSDGLRIKSIQNFSSTDGLVSNFINNAIRWKDKIFVATDQGISYFQPEKLKSVSPPPHLQIDEVLVNGVTINKDSLQNFAYNESDFEIRFTANGMRRPKKKFLYHYRLNAINTSTSNWSATNNREIRFSNLPAGKYTFEVKALNNSGTKFSDIKSYAFDIAPHFANTWWFKSLLALVGISILLIIFWDRINRLKQQTDYERIQQQNLLKINEAQLAALRSQMNPHFIFNSLNAIQNFIFKKDVRQANHFLAKFSRLVRKSLTLSKLDFIPLAQEISFLRDYIELEQMRFPALFNYEISLGEGMNPEEIILPPLLIQPLLENSIRHGFKGLDRKGLITINFEQADHQLQITMCDNGIGFSAAQHSQPANSQHKSFAIKIIKERIQLINQRNQHQLATFSIEEKKDDKNAANGVMAKFVLPTNL